MLTQNLPEGSMRLHSQFSHEGSSAKRRHTTAKGCGLSSSSCTTVFFLFFLLSGKWKVDVRSGLPYQTLSRSLRRGCGLGTRLGRDV